MNLDVLDKTLHVLHIEDKADIQKMVKIYLGKAGEVSRIFVNPEMLD